jgi:acetolactate synthase small subunit
MGLAAMLERLSPIHKVTDLTLRANAVERELAMFKVMGKGHRRQHRPVHQSHAVDRSRRSVAHQRRRDVARAKCDFRPRQPSFSFAIPISKNESPLSTIRL